MNISRMFRPVAFSLVSLLLCISAYGQQPRVAVPNISMPTLDGKTWSLKEESGKVVVLNFWATWCEPCRTEVPYLVRLRREYGEKGLAVAGVTLDEDAKIVERFVAEYKVDYPILLPPAGSPWTKLENTPTTLLIDREGRLAGKYIGAVPEEELRLDVEKLLAESRPK